MAKVTFMRWMLDAKGRRPVSVEPTRVDIIEHYSDEYGEDFQRAYWWGENTDKPIPACTRIVMQGKQEYLVQGDVVTVTNAINAAKSA